MQKTESDTISYNKLVRVRVKGGLRVSVTIGVKLNGGCQGYITVRGRVSTNVRAMVKVKARIRVRVWVRVKDRLGSSTLNTQHVLM